MLGHQIIDDRTSASKFDDVAALVVQPEIPPAEEQTVGDAAASPAISAHEKYHAVYDQNTDFVGWVSIPGTGIDYPVMQSPAKPNYYLNHNFNRQYSNYGVPYIQEDCVVGYSDNVVIYGHHMKDGSMFSDLCRYQDRTFYEEHPTIQFDTLDDYGTWQIVAMFKTVVYSEQGFKFYHFTRADSAAEFDAYITRCKELALYDTGVTAKFGDKLITLSTCEYSQENGRLVVVAKLILPEE